MIDGRRNMISVDMAERAIDEAVADGHPRINLRWCMAPMQRRMLRRYLRMVAPLDVLRSEIDNGAGIESGMFAGIPYVVDARLPQSEIRLDIIAIEGCAAVIIGLAGDEPI